mgnify:CR=1 FL=1
MKKVLFIVVCVMITSSGFAQQKKDSTQIIESKIVTFPIKATKTTDPNYEINKQKSAETQKKMNSEPGQIVKNEQYYQEYIKELKRRINEINTNPNNPNVNIYKLDGLKEELLKLENEYMVFQKSK